MAKAKSSMTSHMVSTRHNLSPEVRAASVALLNQQLADTFDLMSQCKQAHWNVKGSDFMQLHELYDMLAEGLEDHIDTIAERVTALGGVATGTARDAAEGSRLPEFPEGPVEGMASVTALADRFATLAKSTGAAIVAADEEGDLGTADLFTAMVRDLDKWLYFLESHLSK